MGIYKEQLDGNKHIVLKNPNRKWRKWAKNQYSRFLRRIWRDNKEVEKKRKYSGWEI